MSAVYKLICGYAGMKVAKAYVLLTGSGPLRNLLADVISIFC